jgi:hypothetical protein
MSKPATGGKACVPQACTDIPLIGEVCFPPFKLCAGGEAHAGLSSVSGLSTVAIKSINITKFDSAADDNLIASGKIAFAADAITAAGFAGASCDLAGIDIPVDASCSATLRNLQVNGDIRLEVAVDVPTLKKIDLDNLSFSYGAFDVSISGLGPSIT